MMIVSAGDCCSGANEAMVGVQQAPILPLPPDNDIVASHQEVLSQIDRKSCGPVPSTKMKSRIVESGRQCEIATVTNRKYSRV